MSMNETDKINEMLAACNATIDNLNSRFYSADRTVTVLAMALGKLCQRYGMPIEEAFDRCKKAHFQAEVFWRQLSN